MTAIQETPGTIPTGAPPPHERTITIEGKQLGRGNRALFPNFQMPLPDTWRGATIDLRSLLDGVVRAEVAAFRERQQQRTVLQALSAQQIADGVARGKVDSGGNPGSLAEVDADEAVRTALQAFNDGVYYVFVNDTQIEKLDDTIAVGDDSRITFLRLVALAGG